VTPVGHWDGSVLVADSLGLNGKIWLDAAGHPATERLHITERFERTDYGHLSLQMTIDDRQAYTKSLDNHPAHAPGNQWRPF
jgi:hypothetical protein